MRIFRMQGFINYCRLGQVGYPWKVKKVSILIRSLKQILMRSATYCRALVRQLARWSPLCLFLSYLQDNRGNNLLIYYLLPSRRFRSQWPVSCLSHIISFISFRSRFISAPREIINLLFTAGLIITVIFFQEPMAR